jgi:hypothetical protein
MTDMSRIGGAGFAGDGRSAQRAAHGEELADFVSAAAVLFLCAEEGHNPSVRTYWDAVHYVSTSLSVGYANVFPVTQAGKAIGALVQMVGPALSAKALDAEGASPVLSLPR